MPSGSWRNSPSGFGSSAWNCIPTKRGFWSSGRSRLENRKRRGEGKPETFDFLGFTHICGKKRSNGYFTVLRQTIRKRLQAKLNAVKAELRLRMHAPIQDTGKWLRSVVSGHIRYYGVPMNSHALKVFRHQGRLALASGAVAPEPKWPSTLGSDAALDRPLASSCARVSSFSSAPHGRHYLR